MIILFFLFVAFVVAALLWKTRSSNVMNRLQREHYRRWCGKASTYMQVR